MSRDTLRRTAPLEETLPETIFSPLPFENYLTELSGTTEGIHGQVGQQQPGNPGPTIVETSTTQNTMDAQYATFWKGYNLESLEWNLEEYMDVPEETAYEMPINRLLSDY